MLIIPEMLLQITFIQKSNNTDVLMSGLKFSVHLKLTEQIYKTDKYPLLTTLIGQVKQRLLLIWHNSTQWFR